MKATQLGFFFSESFPTEGSMSEIWLVYMGLFSRVSIPDLGLSHVSYSDWYVNKIKPY